MKKIGIIGIGNPLRSDDGIGIFLLQKLLKQKKTLPKEIEFIDGSTGGMNLLHIIAEFNIVIVIDAMNMNSKPGDYRIFKADEIIENESKFFFSTHENNLLQVIQMSKKLGELPKQFFIFGIQPKEISYRPSLSKDLQNKTSSILKSLKKEIKVILSKHNLEQ
jgi:hydrogenase maturation protease